MKPRDRLAGLAAVAAMVRDARLADLRSAAAARAEAEARIGALPAGPELFCDAGGDPGAAVVLAAARARWLERERARCNAELATAHAAEDAARSDAARAFGRADALRRLVEAQAKG